MACAASWEHDAQALRVCALLLEYGACVTERDPSGSTAHVHAQRAKNSKTAAFLSNRQEITRRLAVRELLQDGNARSTKAGKAARSGKPKGSNK